MKKWIKRLSLILMTVIALPGLIYLGLAIYYQDSFMYGTWINGIYCTGKTVSEVADEVAGNFTYDTLYVITPQDVETLETKSLDIQFDFEKALEEYRRNQNPFVWYSHMLTGHQNEEVVPVISFNEEALEQWLYTTDSYKSNLNLEEDELQIILGKNGYEIYEKKEQILNLSLAQEKIAEVIRNTGTEINLEEEGCYFTREETVEMQEAREIFSKIDEFQNLNLVYKIKENERKVMPDELAKFLALDENGQFCLNKKGGLVIDKVAIENFVAQLAKEYDTWGNYDFVTHDGRKINLKKGNYGTQIHQIKEVAFLVNYLREPEDLIRQPEYLKDNTFEDRNNIDNTYVEIDLTAQKMFYFENKKMEIETDVVTGCIANKTITPEMVCYVYGQSRDAILKGKDYRSFVNYWMPVYGGIGIHDATWRKDFGGDIYLKSGSHGCINTPLEVMDIFYPKVQKGTPVVIHY